MADPILGIYRQEALQALEQGTGSDGELLKISPAWIRWTYWLLVLVLAASTAYAVFGTVNEHAVGPAVIRVEGRNDMTATTGGIVVSTHVQPGQRVSHGQLLVRFYVAQETAELERLNQEFELQLVKLLRDPTDQAARESLTTLRAQRDLAEARVAERSLRATVDGVVSDLRIRPGQLLAPGDLVLTLVGDDAHFSLLAFLPGHARPLLKKGMILRTELTGFSYAYRELTVDSIGDEVVGPAEARRYLGSDLGDAYAFEGPVVLVKAHVPDRMFVSEERRFRYYDGLPARAEAIIRRQPIAVALVPALRALWRDCER
jgi:multidrug efflux pump subunit AcrA (membrane-fusion protein)